MIDTKKDEKDVETLLPWYEKGLLSDEDARRVEAYLASDADGLRFLELIREEAHETIAANEQAGMPPRAALDRLMASIEAEPKAQRFAARERRRGFLSRLFGEGAPGWLPVAAGLACLVILVQAVALGVLMIRPGDIHRAPDGTELASGDDNVHRASDTGRSVLIRFNPQATAEDISTLLRALNATIVEGPKPGGVYRVRISNQPLRSEQIEAILKQLRERSDIINFVNG
jgi:hypothetical protein